MADNKFIDGKLVNIRDKLMETSRENDNSPSDTDSALSYKKSERPSGSVRINDKEWKKAVFRRWDEFKALRRDVVLRLNDSLSSIPEDITSSEKRIVELKSAEDKLKKIVSAIEAIDDSGWDRHNLSSELASAMREIENARMDCMLISSRFADKSSGVMQNVQSSSGTSSLHELNSLTFKQKFKFGLGFFFPLIIGIIVAVLIFSVIYFISLNFSCT